MDVGCTNSQSSPLKDQSLGENRQIPADKKLTIYVSEALADEFVSGGGGIDDYPSSWEFSDHAPVMTQFNVN